MRSALVLALLLGLAQPAAATSYEGPREAEQRVPHMLDLLVLRPAGLLLTVGGAVAMVPVGAVTAIVRPTEIHEPLDHLVLRPARFTWLDPLGRHPDRD